jgi:hypothetical protein
MGDFHWIWCKLGDWVRRREAQGDRIRFWIAGRMRQAGSGCRLRRAVAYARLCGADAVDDPDLTTDAVWDSPGAPRLPKRGIIVVQANRHLEVGRGLETWYPELPARHHYPISIPGEAEARAEALLAELGPQRIAVFTGGEGYMGGQQPPEEWRQLLRAVGGTWREVGFVFVGAGADVAHTAAVASALPTERRAWVSNQPVPVLVAALKRCRALIGVAGGPGILGSAFGLPAAMFYPSHLYRMPGAWEPPQMLADELFPWGLLKEMPRCREIVFPMLQRALSTEQVERGQATVRSAVPKA